MKISSSYSVMKRKVDVSRNDYAPDSLTSLNFNFNTNDILGHKHRAATLSRSKYIISLLSLNIITYSNLNYEESEITPYFSSV